MMGDVIDIAEVRRRRGLLPRKKKSPPLCPRGPGVDVDNAPRAMVIMSRGGRKFSLARAPVHRTGCAPRRAIKL